MRTTLLSVSTLASTALARISGIAVPSTITPGSSFRSVIITENYIQSVSDVAISFGLSPGTGHPQSLGTLLDSKFLGPDNSNIMSNISHILTIPADAATGGAVLSAALFSLYGVASSPIVSYFNVSVTVGGVTDESALVGSD